MRSDSLTPAAAGAACRPFDVAYYVQQRKRNIGSRFNQTREEKDGNRGILAKLRRDDRMACTRARMGV